VAAEVAADSAAAGVDLAAADRAEAGKETPMESFLKKYFSSSDLTRVAAKIAEMERVTSGEIRVSVVRRRKWSERSLSLEQLAHRDFHRLEMEKTKDATGVLLFLLLGERKFRIVADRGINERVNQSTWDEIGATLSAAFKEERYLDGLLTAIASIGAVLHQHFPRLSGDTNELSNDVDIRS
jgi:uncharacterized membrane protein